MHPLKPVQESSSYRSHFVIQTFDIMHITCFMTCFVLNSLSFTCSPHTVTDGSVQDHVAVDLQVR